MYLAFFYTFVAAFYTIRIISMQRQTSKVMVFAGTRFCTTWRNHTAFRLFRVFIWGVCVLRLFEPAIDNYLGFFETLHISPIILLGNTLLTMGFVATIILHFYMGNEWRSGIDPQGPTKILINGVYRYSRHPMFVCVAISQLGFFLALPSIFTLTCLIIGIYTLNSQAIAEEKHLIQSSKTDYQSYCTKVRRWI